MSHLLIDASVATKWLFREEHSEKAVLLRRGAIAMRWRFICPPHFVSEVINVVYQQTRRGDPALRLSERRAGEAIDDLLSYPFTPIRSNPLYRHAWAVAREYQIRSIYDALYVALADLYETPMWTADLPLLRTVGDTRLVRWIGDYEG
jgi:predicted nucleic acid-binding protein